MNKYVVTETAVIDAPVTRVWEVISRTDRYAEWVAGAIEVTDHHGVATVGKTYSERNRTLGPPTSSSSGRSRAPTAGTRTEMTYQVEYTIGLGPLGLVLNGIQEPAMRAGMRTSMTNLDALLRSEASRTAP